LGYSLSGPSMLYINNQSALAVAKNPEHHGRMKHLDLRTSDMPADILTKSLPRPKVLEMVKMLGLG
ncbi:hypothetical protein NEOLEDRAFT_1021037, partial [Neolentinus lepideus HHB14362 ss-1]